MVLPSIICLKSAYNNKYLRYRDEDVQTHGLLQFSAEKVMNSLAQFQVITTNFGLVHLKSRYSNKYLVRWSPIHYWISASADEPNEDQTNWACTLFKPSYVYGDAMKYRLSHVQLGHYVSLSLDGAPFNSCLYAGSPDIGPDSRDMFTVLDWGSLLKLPKNVAFKGENGKYLGPFLLNGTPYLRFSFDDPTDPRVAHEVITNFDGTVVIKSKYYGKYWRIGELDWIVADIVDPSSSDTSTMFRVNVVDINVVVLLNMKNTCYCRRLTQSDAQESLLEAGTQSLDELTLLQIKDLGL